ncbi:MAG: hypothetical protein ACTSRA_00360 [Promethearchaeota archaeon]|nr:MAG: hypothetical protein [Helarchaeota virus Nidhogg Meg22_1012]URC17407.1 MAG: hypothetical protein [Helarchaeota virus Nidhogg Meg22_1214]
MTLTQTQREDILSAVPTSYVIDEVTFEPLIEYWKYPLGRYNTFPVIRLYVVAQGVPMLEFHGYKITEDIYGAVNVCELQVDVMARDYLKSDGSKIHGFMIVEEITRKLIDYIRQRWDYDIPNIAINSINVITNQSGMMAVGYVHRRAFTVSLRYLITNDVLDDFKSEKLEKVIPIIGMPVEEDFSGAVNDTLIFSTLSGSGGSVNYYDGYVELNSISSGSVSYMYWDYPLPFEYMVEIDLRTHDGSMEVNIWDEVPSVSASDKNNKILTFFMSSGSEAYEVYEYDTLMSSGTYDPGEENTVKIIKSTEHYQIWLNEEHLTMISGADATQVEYVGFGDPYDDEIYGTSKVYNVKFLVR